MPKTLEEYCRGYKITKYDRMIKIDNTFYCGIVTLDSKPLCEYASEYRCPNMSMYYCNRENMKNER